MMRTRAWRRHGWAALLFLPPYLAIAALDRPDAHIPALLACLGLAFAVYWFACVQGRFPLGAREVLLWGMALRICLLPMQAGDDMHRYLWEGKMLGLGHNPYRLAPGHPFLAQYRDDNWSLINHRGFPALYPPLAEFLFYLLAQVRASALLFKSAFLCCDVLGFLALLGILRQGRSGAGGPEAGRTAPGSVVAAVYFLNPLLIFEIAGRGHFDSLPILCNLAFLWALGAAGRGSRGAAPLFLGLGAMGKIFSLALAPLLFTRMPPLRAAAWCLVLGAGTAGALLAAGAWGSLAGFAADYQYNSLMPYLLEILAGPFLPPAAVRALGFGLFAAAFPAVFILSWRAPAARQALNLMGCLLLFSPTLHPWYLLWPLPFAALCLSRPWLLLTGTVLVTYAVYGRAHALGAWREMPWLRLPEFLPPLLLWLLSRPPGTSRPAPGREAAADPARSDPPAPWGPVRVIIPVLNEERAIASVLRAIPSRDGTQTPGADQVIVVDNGCTDATAGIARSLGATVASEPRRGYGAACLRGMERLAPDTEVVVFLDGDFSDRPEELPGLARPILEGRADLVIGSRTLGRKEPGALLPVAVFGNWLSTRLVKWGWGFPYTDLGPFRAIRYASLRDLGMRDRDFGWTVEMQVKALDRGLRVMEVPVTYRRRVGKSKISGTVKGSIRAGVKILYIIGREWMGGMPRNDLGAGRRHRIGRD